MIARSPAASRRATPATASAREPVSAVDGLAQLSFLIQNTLARRAGEHDLSMIQTRLLGVLRDREPTMNELARLLELDKSSITGLIGRAVKRGLVERVPSDRDGRAAFVRLTDNGRSLAAEVGARFAADIEEILAHLSAADRETLASLISRLLTRAALA